MKTSPRQSLKKLACLRGMVNALREIPNDVGMFRSIIRRKSIVDDYLCSVSEPRKLQIGAGKNVLEGWLNCDLSPNSESVVYLDATERFPFPDESFDFVFSEHMIEHVPFEGGQRMLSECLRSLKRGGVIRLSTPNLKNIASLMTEPWSDEKAYYVKTSSERYIPDNRRSLPGFVVNNFFWDFSHYFVYDPDSMTDALERSGFVNIRQVDSGKSSYPALCGLECHAKIVGDTLDQFESMIFEAEKPG